MAPPTKRESDKTRNKIAEQAATDPAVTFAGLMRANPNLSVPDGTSYIEAMSRARLREIGRISAELQAQADREHQRHLQDRAHQAGNRNWMCGVSTVFAIAALITNRATAPMFVSIVFLVLTGAALAFAAMLAPTSRITVGDVSKLSFVFVDAIRGMAHAPSRGLDRSEATPVSDDAQAEPRRLT